MAAHSSDTAATLPLNELACKYTRGRFRSVSIQTHPLVKRGIAQQLAVSIPLIISLIIVVSMLAKISRSKNVADAS